MAGKSVMVVDGGARGHVISEAYEKSDDVERIIVVPGNGLIPFRREKEVLADGNCGLTDPHSILALAEKYKPDLVDVAQDDALAVGTVDLLQDNGFTAFGPTREAARIEWDKVWSRRLMKKHGIPHPGFRSFSSENGYEARRHLEELYSENPERLVYVKAAGLCAGKGALDAGNLQEALSRVEQMSGFGNAGKYFVIEEGLVGEEFSCYALTDGKYYNITKSAQDNKRVFDNDRGGQTGGMGATAPAMVTQGIMERVDEEMIRRAIRGMSSEDIPYRGILYLGGILLENGDIMNIEYNSRWGDPEVQAILPGFTTDYLKTVESIITGRFGETGTAISEDDMVRICVVGASRGYPGDYSAVKGKEIRGLDDAMKTDGVRIFGAGISEQDGGFYASGGRLFSVVGEGADLKEARERAYEAIRHISVDGDGLHYRTDIGIRDINRL